MTLKGLPRLLHLFFVLLSSLYLLPIIVPSLSSSRSLAFSRTAWRCDEPPPAFLSPAGCREGVNPAKRRFNWIDMSATAKTGKQVISIYEFLTGDNKFGTIAVCIIARDVLRPFLFFYGATFLGREPPSAACVSRELWCCILVPYLHLLFRRFGFNIPALFYEIRRVKSSASDSDRLHLLPAAMIDGWTDPYVERSFSTIRITPLAFT